MAGYRHPLYAESFSEIGTPIFLPKSRGWLIKRKIPGTDYFDAMGTYPLFFCEDWDYLVDDIISLSDELIAVSFVIGPLEVFPVNAFQNFFDVLYKYRPHYLLDTKLPIEEVVSSGRRRDVLKALQKVKVEKFLSPNIDLDEWCLLYQELVNKHQISDFRAFSRKSFQKQLAIPDTHFFRVAKNEEIVGGALFYLQDDTAYYHLAAQTKKGYDLHASYAAMWVAINILSNSVHWIELQGGRSLTDEVIDGLSEFKKGWASLKKKSYFCGKILNHDRYHEILNKRYIPDTNWFPVYRSGEFDQNSGVK